MPDDRVRKHDHDQRDAGRKRLWNVDPEPRQEIHAPRDDADQRAPEHRPQAGLQWLLAVADDPKQHEEPAAEVKREMQDVKAKFKRKRSNQFSL